MISAADVMNAPRLGLIVRDGDWIFAGCWCARASAEVLSLIGRQHAGLAETAISMRSRSRVSLTLVARDLSWKDMQHEGAGAIETSCRVYAGDDGVQSYVREELAALLDGLALVRLGPTASDAHAGVDENGLVTVIVMPVRP